MKALRSGMLMAAIAAFAVSFLFLLSAVPQGRSTGPTWPVSPGMMGWGGMMGPGMMGRGGMVGPGLVAPRATPPPAPLATAGMDNSGILTGLLLLPVGGAALMGWWWAGRPARPRDRARETPLEIAKRRYVDGDITLLEFDQMVQGLLGSEARELEPARSKKR